MVVVAKRSTPQIKSFLNCPLIYPEGSPQGRPLELNRLSFWSLAASELKSQTFMEPKKKFNWLGFVVEILKLAASFIAGTQV